MTQRTATLSAPRPAPAAAGLGPCQRSLFGGGEAAFDDRFVTATRVMLDDESWVEHVPGWLSGADDLLDELVARVPWRQREVTMYDRRLPEPRLTWWWSTASATREPVGVLRRIRISLADHYGRSFDSIGFNLYRDGRDSVAWHGDRERFHLENPVVVILSLGQSRSFHLRPSPAAMSSAGREPHRFTLAAGDLLVMGGACQHDWQHCVPKSAQPMGPRVSVMFRHDLAGWSRRDGVTDNAAGSRG